MAPFLGRPPGALPTVLLARHRCALRDRRYPSTLNAPGLEQTLRHRALRFSWIKDVVQAVAFTLAGLVPKVSDTDVSVRIVVDALGERDGVVTLRARTIQGESGARPCPSPGEEPGGAGAAAE